MSQNVGTTPLFLLISQPWTSARIWECLRKQPRPERLAATPSECLNLHQDLIRYQPLAGMGYQLECRERHPIVYAFAGCTGTGCTTPLYFSSLQTRFVCNLAKQKMLARPIFAHSTRFCRSRIPQNQSAATLSGPTASMIAGEDLINKSYFGLEHAPHGGKRPKQLPALEEAPHHQVESKWFDGMYG